MSLADLSNAFDGLAMNPMFNAGLGIMAASGPSLTPHSLGQSIVSGMETAQTARLRAAQALMMGLQAQRFGMQNQAIRGVLGNGQLGATGSGDFATPDQARAATANLGAPSANAGDAPMLASANGTAGTSYAAPGAQPQPGDPSGGMASDPYFKLGFAFNPAQASTQYLNRAYPQPTDFVKTLQAAGIDPSSTLGRQLIQQNIAKQNYITPTRVNGGGGLYDPATGQFRMIPKAIDGTVPVQLPSGQWAAQPVLGGQQAIAGAATAQASGRANFAPMTYTDAQGVQHTTTQAAFAGGASAAQPTADQQMGVLSAQATDMVKNGVPPEAAQAWLENKAKALGVGYQSAPQAGGGAPNVAGPSPGFVPGQSGLAKNNVQDFAETQDNGKEAALRMNVLDNVINLSQQGVKTGPGSDWQNHMLGMAANIPGLDKVLSGTQGNVAKFQEMQKFLNQAGMRSWQAAGGTQTDSQLNAAQHANPNSAQFPQALQTVARWVKAGDLAAQSKANAQAQWMQANGRDVSKLDQFESEWRQHYDPLVFQLQTMAPEDAAAKIKSLSPREAKSLIADRQWMMPYMQANP